MALIRTCSTLPDTAQGCMPYFVAATVLYLSWRLWRFTIEPALNPTAPKPFPYLLPFLGHVVPMSNNSSKVFTRGREYFGDTREFFSLTVMGEDMYIVTSPTDVLSVYRETKKLDFDGFVKEVMKDFGCTEDTVTKMFDVNGKPKHWMDTCHDNFKLQMHPGDRFEVLQADFLKKINDMLRWDRISGQSVKTFTEDSKTVSLWKWCGEVLVHAATKTFFGEAIYRVAPDVVSDFFTFDDEAWKMHYKYPKFAARDMYSAKERGEKAFTDYLSLPKEEREDAAWIVKQIEQGMGDVGISEPTQCGAMLFSLHRLINTNAYRQCFWCLAYLLHEPELLEAVKAEIRPGYKSDTLDMSYLLQNCPLLASFYEEMLRVNNDPIGIRLVTQEATIGGKTLKPGRKLLMPYKQLHFDSGVFGDNVNQFDPRRFLNDKNLLRSTSWRPFGGASTHCPGRFLARREVYMFVAIVLFRFDIRMVPAPGEETPRFPRVDEAIPAGGLLPPVSGDDVFVEVRCARV